MLIVAIYNPNTFRFWKSSAAFQLQRTSCRKLPQQVQPRRVLRARRLPWHCINSRINVNLGIKSQYLFVKVSRWFREYFINFSLFLVLLSTLPMRADGFCGGNGIKKKKNPQQVLGSRNLPTIMLGQLQAQKKKLWNPIYVLALSPLLHTKFILNDTNIHDFLLLNVEIVLRSA